MDDLSLNYWKDAMSDVTELTTLEEKEDGSIEAVKVYYLASNYYLFFNEKSGATGSWYVR